jgi:hypothetical protein
VKETLTERYQPGKPSSNDMLNLPMPQFTFRERLPRFEEGLSCGVTERNR